MAFYNTIIGALLVGFMLHVSVVMARADNFKVLVVMSYEEDYPWVKEIRDGLEPALSKAAQIKYFYMDTKTNWQGGPEKAKEALALFESFKPDGVIAADDDAQAMFVVPYLKNRVATPVVFCGVNAQASAYGYPASNVTGLLEREPMKQSLLLLQQLVPSVKRFGYISKNSPTDKAVELQLSEEKESYPIEYVGSRIIQTLKEARVVSEELKSKCDALLYVTMEGLPDENGHPLTDKEIMPVIAHAFGKPVITNALYRVKYGALSAVVKTGEEHGRMAAELLLSAMRGKPVAKIPITQNRFGQRIINIDVMRSLGIQPKPELIRSALLVRTEQ
ncbi:MAG: ABC transporter substrate binding protein [Desulfobacteraceae bacterium]|nr:ABC transporter substrate binding protein [Desulfobacteraceae bacterium]